jgi:hypothetical protein
MIRTLMLSAVALAFGSSVALAECGHSASYSASVTPPPAPITTAEAPAPVTTVTTR